ncbi:MAG TPA: phosphoribosylformylglycinamidine synthase subunit PurL [bacterium]|jgi:phosphoribosylformylglycinamidine synthase
MNVHTIETTLKSEYPDPVASGILSRIRNIGIDKITGVKVANIFKFKGDFDSNDLERIARFLLADSVTEEYSINTPVLDESGGTVFEVAFNPGVMDPVEQSARKALTELGIKNIDGIKTGKKYIFSGKTDPHSLNLFASGNLYNKVIQHLVVDGENPFPASTKYEYTQNTVELDGKSDDELLDISRTGLLSLNIDEMLTIQEYFRKEGRDPTDVELETIAQTWSEHCYHKTFRSKFDFNGKGIPNLLKSTVMKATTDLNLPWCVSVFVDNAGIISFDDEYDLCFKVETHNHPSALEPYGGAGTGIGGVIRDILGTGLGAKPIANTDIFCFAPPDTANEKLPDGVLHPRRIMEGVVSGVRDYGNRMGIPTLNGAICFHPDYIGNPLVYCGTVGLIPKGMDQKEAKPGDYIAVIGGRTGRDGIHGATFSSIELDKNSEVTSGGAVQIGNPIEEKRFMDAMLIARDRGLYNAVTDCGAGGFSSAVGEMGEKVGAKVHLERAPLKYEGLAPWEIWVSEAQERMVLSVPPDKWDEFKNLMDSWDVECTHLGEFTGSKRLEIFYNDHQVCNLSMEFLHEGIPPGVRTATWTPKNIQEPEIDRLIDDVAPVDLLKRIMGHLDVCSKEWVIRQYDHEVQGAMAIKPLTGARNDGPSDASVIRPRLESDKGCAISNGINVRYGGIDPYHMACCVIDEALRNVVAVGGNPERTAILDNFSWGSSTHPERLGELVRASQGCHDAALAFGTPFISGKDSLNNEYRVGEKTIHIPPTLLISAMSIVDDVNKCITMDAKRAGNHIYIVGTTKKHLGGSVFYDTFGLTGASVPEVDLEIAPKIFKAMHAAIQSGLIASCHDISDGGIGACVSEMCFSGGLGCIVDLEQVPADGELKPAEILYCESPSRFIIEIDPENASQIEQLFSGLPFAKIGTLTEADNVIIWSEWKKEYIKVSIDKLKESWQKPLAW